MLNSSLLKYSFLNALGTFAYIGLIAFLGYNTQNVNAPDFLAPIFLLTLFIISATVTGSLVLGRPLYLIIHGKMRDGIFLLVATLIWLSLFLGVLFAVGLQASYITAG